MLSLGKLVGQLILKYQLQCSGVSCPVPASFLPGNVTVQWETADICTAPFTATALSAVELDSNVDVIYNNLESGLKLQNTAATTVLLGQGIVVNMVRVSLFVASSGCPVSIII